MTFTYNVEIVYILAKVDNWITGEPLYATYIICVPVVILS